MPITERQEQIVCCLVVGGDSGLPCQIGPDSEPTKIGIRQHGPSVRDGRVDPKRQDWVHECLFGRKATPTNGADTNPSNFQPRKPPMTSTVVSLPAFEALSLRKGERG